MIKAHHIRKGHRKAGIAISIIVVMLASTGLLLNHSGSLHLGKKYLHSPWLLAWYGLSEPDIASFRSGGVWVHGLAGMVYLGSKPVAECGQLNGVVSAGAQLHIACTTALLSLTSSGEVIEVVDASMGLPVPVSGLVQQGKEFYLAAGGSLYLMDIDALSFQPVPPTNERYQGLLQELSHGKQAALAMPANMREELLEKAGYGVTLERLLLDIHSGRILGVAGVIIVDAAVILFMFLALSGLWIAAKRK